MITLKQQYFHNFDTFINAIRLSISVIRRSTGKTQINVQIMLQPLWGCCNNPTQRPWARATLIDIMGKLILLIRQKTNLRKHTLTQFLITHSPISITCPLKNKIGTTIFHGSSKISLQSDITTKSNLPFTQGAVIICSTLLTHFSDKYRSILKESKLEQALLPCTQKYLIYHLCKQQKLDVYQENITST